MCSILACREGRLTSVFNAEDFLGYVYQSEFDGLWREVAWIDRSFVCQGGHFPTEGAAIQGLMDSQCFHGPYQVANDIEDTTSGIRA